MRIHRIVKPGEKVPDSGIYESSQSKHRATMVKDDIAPPTPQQQETWVQVIDTKTTEKTITIRMNG